MTDIHVLRVRLGMEVTKSEITWKLEAGRSGVELQAFWLTWVSFTSRTGIALFRAAV